MTNDYGNLELHTVLLAAMKDIDKICREHGLKYYLHAGTLLGAINHHGFIPWDDDVDISMFRNDYEKFLDIVTKEFSEKYYVHNYHTDVLYRNNRSVLRILGTTVETIHEAQNASTHREIGIDIVPLDSAPDSLLLRKAQQALIWLFDVAVQIKYRDIIPQSIPMKALKILSLIDRKKLGAIIDYLCEWFNNKNTKYVGLLSYTGKNPYTGNSGYENDLLLREWYEKPIFVAFEDAHFMTIATPEKDLLHRYGPHWHDPYPEEKRVTKHDVKTYYITPEVREQLGL